MANKVQPVDLKWRDAMAVWSIGSAFSRKRQAAGWPEAMTPAQIAGMQRPWHQVDLKVGRPASSALQAAIVAACDANEILHVSSVDRVLVAPALDVTPSPFDRRGGWPDAYTIDGYRVAYTRPAKYRDVKVYRIDAAAFATWLHAQGEAPSQHIAAWFTSQGVAWPPVLAVDADTVADWPGLVVLVKNRKKGTRWTEGEVAILRAEFERRGGWNREADGQPWVKNSSIQSDMATELGFSARSALDRHLGDGPDRGSAVMSSAVGALTGTR